MPDPSTSPGWLARSGACLGLMLALLPGLTACGGGEAPAQPTTAAAAPGEHRQAVAPVSTDLLFGWAELQYHELFPSGPVTAPLSAGGVSYSVRHYPLTGNYIGVAVDGGVWGYGPFTQNVLTTFGPIQGFACLVSPDACQPNPPSCRTTVDSGFSGNLDALYPESTGGGDGGSAGDGDGGSAGVGGSEGKVLGARLRVIRLADGALLGEGLTDPILGLSTVKWCPQDLPVLLEMQGAPGARYFDEAINDLVPFPVTQKLRALVDRFDENVGVSALTEAAYVYAMNNVVGDSAAVAAGTRALVTEGVPLRMTSAQVRQVNGQVLGEVNRRFTDRLQQVSIKALATPIDQRSRSDALPKNRYGRMAALTGGFAKLAKGYNASASAPALTFSKQLARDLSDGVIDDYALDGAPAAASGQLTYKGTEAGANWTLGQGALSLQFGRTTTLLDGEPYIDDRFVWLEYADSCAAGWGELRIGHYYLSTIGTVTLVESRAPAGGCIWDPGTTSSSRLDFLTGVRKLAGTTVGDRLFAITLDGDVFGWGLNGCGRVGNGVVTDTITSVPVKVAGIGRVVDIVATYGANIALTADGEVYTWGANHNALLGQGDLAAEPLCNDRQFGSRPAFYVPVRVIGTPRKLAGLSNIVAISGSSSFVTAVRADGRVFQWGSVPGADGRVTQKNTPQELPAVRNPRKVSSNERMSFGIVDGGQVVTWWLQPDEIFVGEAAASVKQPKTMKDIANVVDIVSDPLGTTLALRNDGTLLVWGSWFAQPTSIASTPRRLPGAWHRGAPQRQAAAHRAPERGGQLRGGHRCRQRHLPLHSRPHRGAARLGCRAGVRRRAATVLGQAAAGRAPRG